MAMNYYQNKVFVRIKHSPSNHEVMCDKERHQHKNIQWCIRTIKAKLYADNLGLQRPIINERTEGTICPICESGILVEKHEYLRYTYNSGFRLDPEGEYKVLSLYLQCQLGCGSEQMDAHCLKYNKETMLMLSEMKEKELNVG
jgi:hypothetical protein